MSSTAGHVLVADFDGTLVRLGVDWASLRGELGVRSLAALRDGPGSIAYERIARAERDGAARGDAIKTAIAFAASFERFAVLTENSESAVRVFLRRMPDLDGRCAAVVGRETLAGRKRDFESFSRGVALCLRALGSDGPRGVAYLGDSEYELGFARLLDLRPVDVASLG